MKRNLLSLSLLLASLCGGALPLMAQASPVASHAATSIGVPDPATQIRTLASMLRASDLNGLVRGMLPPDKFQELRLAYDRGRAEAITDEDRTEFAQGVAKLTGADAVDTLMAEIEPKLAEARPQAEGAILVGLGALQMAIAKPDSELTDEQREALRSALPGVQRWATTTDFLSSQAVRQALTLLTDAARRTGITSLDQLKMMSFEQTLDQAGNLLTAAKQALRIYGLDVDAITDSLRVEVLAIEGQTARVRTTVTLFDAPVSKEIELVLVDGRWYGKDVAAVWTIHSEDDAEG